MYHGRDGCTGPASWFIVSLKGSPIITKWAEKANKHYSNYKTNYFWMDSLFKELYDGDQEFKNEWDRVPNICCEDAGQAHMLAGKCGNDDPDTKRLLDESPAYAIKLSHHDGFNEGTNAAHAIKVSMNRGSTLPSVIDFKIPPPLGISDYVMIISDCKHESSLKELNNLCKQYKVQPIVYDKCNLCSHVPTDMYTRPLGNTGRDMGTFLYFIITYYDDLPRDIILTAGNLEKHNRLERITTLLKDDTIECENSGTLGSQGDFTLDVYDNVKLEPSDTRPFKDWYIKYVGEWDDDTEGACWNGIMRTNRDRIISKPIEFYKQIYEQIRYFDSTEVVHYIERAMKSIF
jgi:hypothetical protein